MNEKYERLLQFLQEGNIYEIVAGMLTNCKILMKKSSFFQIRCVQNLKIIKGNVSIPCGGEGLEDSINSLIFVTCYESFPSYINWSTP